MSKLNGRSTKRRRQLLHHVDEHQQRRGGQAAARAAARARARAPRPALAPSERAASSMLGVILREARLDRLQRDREEAHEVGIDQRGDACRSAAARACTPKRRSSQPASALSSRAERHQHADRDHRARHRIAEAGDAVGRARPAAARRGAPA